MFHELNVVVSRKSVPDNSVCFIQLPSNENPDFLNLMTLSPFEYYKQIILTPSNKESIIKVIEAENVEEYFQSIEIRFNEKLLFEGYDGIKYGTISRSLQLTDRFIYNFINEEMCIISEEW